MGTRGLFGFKWKGKYYLVYNHHDSFDLRYDLVREIKEMLSSGQRDAWIKMLENIIIVDEETKPAECDIEKLKKYADLGVSTRSTTDWHCLLSRTQGSYVAVLESGYMINYSEEYLTGDLHIECSYVLDFDKNTFAFYTSKKGLVYEQDINTL